MTGKSTTYTYQFLRDIIFAITVHPQQLTILGLALCFLIHNLNEKQVILKNETANLSIHENYVPRKFVCIQYIILYIPSA